MPTTLRTPAVFSDHMVLQRGACTPVWGWAEPARNVTVRIANQEHVAAAAPDGRWQVTLKPLPPGGPYTMTVAAVGETLTFDDVLVGDVWLCSGQSNMGFNLSEVRNAEQELATTDRPRIRLFGMPRTVASEPQEDCEGAWRVCTRETAAVFSAVGYFFGRALQEALDVPIGLVDASWGGTPAESWMRLEALQSDLSFAPIIERRAEALGPFREAKEAYARQIEGVPAAERPAPPEACQNAWLPAGLFNAMISPLIPYSLRGVIWYQGESNADRSYQYRRLFPALIRDWRAAWGRPDLPFLWAQLANYAQPEPEPSESAWAELREAQAMALLLPHTGQAVLIDVGEADDIHPKNKQDVGARLARAARAVAYGEEIVGAGPELVSTAIEENAIRLGFRNTGRGLICLGGGEELTGFAIAGADRRFVWARAEIEGESVVVSHPDVPAPVAVRYAWANNPVCNLYNAEALPASPLRTDDWPCVTRDAG